MEEKTIYYLIYGWLLGKENEQGDFLFKNGRWVPDNEKVIMDHHYGYDPYEPDGSPYKMFNQSIMDEIEEITAEQAAKLCEGHL